MRLVEKLLSHLSIAMLMGMVVLVIMDNHNPLMKFLTSVPSKTYIIVMCAAALISLVLYAARLNRE